MLQWYLGLHDLHNFPIAEKDYRSFFKKDFLDGGYLKSDGIDLNDVYGWKQEKIMSPNEKLGVRQRAEVWKDKFYPVTSEENKKIFDDYLTLCEQKNIKPVVFTAPVSEGYRYCFPKKCLDEFHAVRSEIMSRHPTSSFFDGWKVKGLSDADFFDTDHINVFGAAKFSAALNNFIMKHSI